MAEATVKTVQYLDPRIEPQPDPVYEHVIAPTQNQYYQIPASGFSNSSINFNNLTTLGADRAYLDTFEVELEADLIFTVANNMNSLPLPLPGDWTFDSFPFSKCCDEIRVNINGGAFFSQPAAYLRAKERYMKQYELSKCYENVCPVHKPICQTESGKNYNMGCTLGPRMHDHQSKADDTEVWDLPAIPSRYGRAMDKYMMSSEGVEGGFNNSIVTRGAVVNGQYVNYRVEDVSGSEENKVTKTIIHVKWREPVACSPFSSKYDATYGRPLYNITSMDLGFTMTTLAPMVRYANYSFAPFSLTDGGTTTYYDAPHITDLTVDLKSARLCYQVMTIPPQMTKPLTTLVPYRRFVPYISNYSGNSYNVSNATSAIPADGARNITMRSGVYTLNEIPTAIWLFVGPTKRMLQQWPADSFKYPALESGASENEKLIRGNLGNSNYYPAHDSNRLFGYIKKVNLSLANTTQILNTAQVEDLYRIAKANGCQDSFWSWAGDDVVYPKTLMDMRAGADLAATEIYSMSTVRGISSMFYGAGSVLRLKPGVDLIVPDQPLIPGANARNMVFQAEVEFNIPPHAADASEYALWLIFEYVGVAAISPGQCEITMNPLGTGEIMEASPIMSTTTAESDGVIDNIDASDTRARGVGAGEMAKKTTQYVRSGAKDALSKTLENLVANAPETTGAPASKRGRAVTGGRKIGYNDWL